MLTTILTLPLVATAMLAVALLATADARRTAGETHDAQLRQLLVAGGTVLLDQSRSWPAAPKATTFEVPVPQYAATEGDGIQISTQPDGDAVIATVAARHAGRQATQRLRLTRSGNAWTIESVALDAPDALDSEQK
jgi:hypothetical protein